MESVKNTFDLNDTFRNINPQIRRYSHVEKNKKRKSRIDRIYISVSEPDKVLKQNFKETPWYDHKIVVVELSQSIDRGPGQWALNTDLPKFSHRGRKTMEHILRVQKRLYIKNGMVGQS